MSWVFVNAGQCGNQVGHEIGNSLWNSLIDTEELDLFFNTNCKGKSNLRSVNLDTEEKVVRGCVEKCKSLSWSYDARSVVHKYGGAGNNWAMGHDMCKGEFLEDSLNAIRLQLELCDIPAGLFISHSVGGGTGSGYGTHLTEALYDEFNDISRINFAVTPYHFGEVIVQHYNSLLCLSKISSTSDAIILFENEVASNICKSSKGIKSPSLYDINQTIAANIVPVLLSKYSLENVREYGCYKKDNCDTSSDILMTRKKNIPANCMASGGASRNVRKTNYNTKSYPAIKYTISNSFTLHNDIIRLCSHPYYKFLSVYNTPQSSALSLDFTFDSWPSIFNSLGKMQQTVESSSQGEPLSIPIPHNLETNEKLADTVMTPPKPPTQSNIATPPVSARKPFVAETFRKPKCVGSLITLRGLDPHVAIDDICNKHHSSNSSYNMHHRHHAGISPTKVAGSGSHRGNADCTSSVSVLNSIMEQFYAQPSPQSMKPIVSCYGSYHLANDYQRSGCCIANNDSCVSILQRSLSKAHQLYDAGAYLHHYYDYGLENQDFVSTLQSIAQTVHNYQAL